jgi:hypothetical protein
VFNLFKKIMPKEERFFDLFDQHAACLTAGSLTLRGCSTADRDVAPLPDAAAAGGGSGQDRP